MIKLDKYKSYISYRRGKLAPFIRDVLDSHKIKLDFLIIDEGFDKKYLCVKYGFEGTDDIFFVDDFFDKKFDGAASEIINKIYDRHHKTVDITELKKIAKLQIIKYKRK